MKKFGIAALLSAICLGLTGCATQHTHQYNDGVRRFEEAASVTAVLKFSGWDYTFLVQPRYDENGFLLPVTPTNIAQVFDQLNVRRDLAVVTIGWTYQAEMLAQLVARWKSILARCGFRRVVFLRASLSDNLNGSLIIDDEYLSVASSRAPGPRPAAVP